MRVKQIMEVAIVVEENGHHENLYTLTAGGRVLAEQEDADFATDALNDFLKHKEKQA